MHWYWAASVAGYAIILPGMSYAHVVVTKHYGVAFNLILGGGLLLLAASGALDEIGHPGGIYKTTPDPMPTANYDYEELLLNAAYPD